MEVAAFCGMLELDEIPNTEVLEFVLWLKV